MKRKERRKGQAARERRGKYKERKGERGGPQMTDLPVNQKRELNHTVIHTATRSHRNTFMARE